ncbi:lipopolysaccharide biosynthesis protein [Salisediminibacterium beveridgei]|uniref:LPS biosynthesis protein n=1 Tax=Salisediminibacterium beveridgei TaxID=632773 RepID=A0A1D7QRP0_9BACI|nr:lipopolysaccharide biosynthesis protein [Salisediminibacterium beveridgei]AOM81663.1 LPS biosynthesis protein [Salisediminibacterium beveridgei]
MTRNKTISGLVWSFTELLSKQGLTLIIQIMLARLLLPEHFGLIGMITIFIAISTSLVQSGLDQALIREKNPGKRDFSTVFYFNIAVSVALYLVLFFSAPWIADFFGEPQLIDILRVLMLVVIINSLAVIQRVILIRNIDFKTQTKITVIAAVTSGVIAISMAVAGLGVWSLVAQQVSMQFMTMVLLWVSSQWRPALVFDTGLFKKYFTFGYKLLLSGLIDTTYKNIYFVIIGRLYPVDQLGYYTNAQKLRDTSTQSISQAISKVTYPVLSQMQDDQSRLAGNYKKLIQMTSFLMFPFMIGLMVTAPQFIPFLLGEHWQPSVIFFQLLAVAGMLYPIHALNLNVLKVKNRSDLFLFLEILKKSVLTILLVSAVVFGDSVESLIYAAIISSVIALVINTYYSGREIQYPLWMQLKDMLPSLSVASIMAVIVHVIGVSLTIHVFFVLVIQITVGIGIYVLIGWGLKMREFKVMLELLKSLKKS